MFVPIEVVTFLVGIFVGIFGTVIFKDIYDDSVY
jgi:hypothetical protein